MSEKNTTGRYFASALQWVLNLGLMILAIILVVFLGKETIHLATVLFSTGEQASSYLLIEGVMTPTY